MTDNRIGFLRLAYALVYHHSQDRNDPLPNDERLAEDEEEQAVRKRLRAERLQRHLHFGQSQIEQDGVKEACNHSVAGG